MRHGSRFPPPESQELSSSKGPKLTGWKRGCRGTPQFSECSARRRWQACRPSTANPRQLEGSAPPTGVMANSLKTIPNLSAIHAGRSLQQAASGRTRAMTSGAPHLHSSSMHARDDCVRRAHGARSHKSWELPSRVSSRHHQRRPRPSTPRDGIASCPAEFKSMLCA